MAAAGHSTDIGSGCDKALQSNGAPAPSVSRRDGGTVLWLHGEQDIATLPVLSAALATILTDYHGDVVVDLSLVEFIDASTLRRFDASTIGALVRADGALRPQSRELRVRYPSRRAQHVIELCGLMHLVQDPSASTPAEFAPASTLPSTRFWSRLVQRRHREPSCVAPGRTAG